MHCFLCFSYAAKIERGTTISSDAIVRQRRNDHMRFKRILNVTDLSVISIEDHDAKYPFIVGVKTKQHLYDGKNVKTTVRCTGTMITSQLVLTTGYCVRNAITIKVQCTVSSIVEPIEQNLKDSTYTYKLKCVDLQKKFIIWKGIVQLCMVDAEESRSRFSINNSYY